MALADLMKIDTRAVDATPLSERICKSAEFIAIPPGVDRRFRVSLDNVDFKALMSLSNGFSAPNPRSNVVSFYPQRRIVISDLIPSDMTVNQVVRYVRETVEPLVAAVVAEGELKPEAQMVFEEAVGPVAKIPAWIPVTSEQLADVSDLRHLIDQRLLLQCLIEEENQFMNGAGGSSNIDGFYNATGVQTQSKGSDTLADALFKAISKVRFVGRSEPTAVLIHPGDYESERLRKDTMGNYIWGPPTLPPPAYIWEKLAVVTDAVTVGQPLVGDFTQAHISRRAEGNFSATESHGEFFARNIYALRAEVRTSMEIYRPSAFCYVVP